MSKRGHIKKLCKKQVRERGRSTFTVREWRILDKLNKLTGGTVNIDNIKNIS